MRSLFYLVACLIATFAVSVEAEDAWLQFGGPSRDFRFDDSNIATNHAPTKRWQQTLGPGMSGIVISDDTIYTMFLAPFEQEELKKPESDRKHREVVIALDAENGQLRWRYEYDAGWIESQQAFGGRVRAPQATPAIHGDHLVTIGFTGLVHCIDRKNGVVTWKKNVVKTFDSVPVQFGFSASPVAIDDCVVLFVGGKGGLLCVKVSSGETVWSLPCQEASYVTPVVWNRPDGKQIVFVTRNRIVGVAADNGAQLWDYRLPGPGMTNVPTPMPIDDKSLLVSGQGIKGTRRLQIASADSEYQVSEVWQSNEQFFYCNWVRREGILWGCDGKLLIAMDLETGKRLGRFRGFTNGNILLGERMMLTSDGEGHLSKLQLVDRDLKAVERYAVLNERCWTPPTPSGDYLYWRGGDQLLCLDLVGGDPQAAVTCARISKPLLSLAADTPVDPLNEIVAAYEAGGDEAAWAAYKTVRNRDPDAISFEMRGKLANMATAEGLTELATLIRQHAAEDFPEAAKEAIRSPSRKASRGDNGLVYIEFAIRNSGPGTIQAYVKGPKEHPFSYGLPLPSKQRRIEKWPVGTTLYRTRGGIRKEPLLTVQENYAGKVIDIPLAE